MASMELPKLPKVAKFHLGHPGAHFQLRRKPSSSDSSESDPDEYNIEKSHPDEYNIEKALFQSRAHEGCHLVEEYETEFNQRPKGLSQKANWLLNLEEQKEPGWYRGFCDWYEEKLRQGSKRDGPPPDSLHKLLCESYGKKDRMKSIAKTLKSQGNNNFFYLGIYGGHGLALSLNGSALDPPTMPLRTFITLKLPHARLNMFVGIRPQETKDLCVLTLGNIWATEMLSKQIKPFDQPADWRRKVGWLDTKYVLAVDTVLSQKLRYYLIYKYEVYDVEYLEGGGERRDEEPEDVKPPTFCKGPQAFTIGLLKKPQNPVRDMTYENMKNDQDEIELEVLETKKPQLAMAGYKDDQNPYVPLFLPRDKSKNI